MRQNAYALIRDACVLRFGYLIEEKASREPEQILEVLMVMKENIRVFDPSEDADVDQEVPRWAAVLDYFETHLSVTDANGRRHWVLWCGPVSTEYGMLHAYITSPFWDVGLLQRFYEDELCDFELVRARPTHIDRVHYPRGTLAPLTIIDRKRVERLVSAIEPMDVGGFVNELNYLTLPNMVYDTSPAFCVESHLQGGLRALQNTGNSRNAVFNGHKPSWLKVEETLSCRFEIDQEGYDWEMAVSRLGENVIRIMSRFVHRKCTEREALKTFGDAWGDVADRAGNYNEADAMS